jgi:hypothetical protein
MSQVQQSNDDLLLELESIDTRVDTLNTNGAIESKQDTMITSLQNIETNTAGTGLGDTGAASSVAVSITSVTLVAANSARREVIIRNDTNNVLYIAHGGTATLSSAVKLKKGDTYIEDKYTGIISGIWDSVGGGGNAQITEIDVA